MAVLAASQTEKSYQGWPQDQCSQIASQIEKQMLVLQSKRSLLDSGALTCEVCSWLKKTFRWFKETWIVHSIDCYTGVCGSFLKYRQLYLPLIITISFVVLSAFQMSYVIAWQLCSKIQYHIQFIVISPSILSSRVLVHTLAAIVTFTHQAWTRVYEIQTRTPASYLTLEPSL